MALPEVPRGRPRLPKGRGRQLVPERPDRACERAGEGRPLRALRCRGRGAQARRVVLPHHRVRRSPARRDEGRGVAGARAGDAAQLDRPVGRRGGPLPGRRARHRHPGVHDTSRHAVRCDLLRARARASARRPAAEQSPNGDEIRDYARKAGARPAEERAAGTDKTGVFTGFFATNPVNDARIPDLDRRLRPDGVRHRRDHGRARARRARPGVRRAVRPADQGRHRRRGQARRLGAVLGPAARGGGEGDRRMARHARPRAPGA